MEMTLQREKQHQNKVPRELYFELLAQPYYFFSCCWLGAILPDSISGDIILIAENLTKST